MLATTSLYVFNHRRDGDAALRKILAQQQFQIGTLRLLAPDGHSLDPCSSLEKENIQDGDSLTAMAQEIHIASNKGAFVLWSRGGRRTLPQGRKNNGGDNVEVFEQLQNVQHVEATDYSFAAIQGDLWMCFIFSMDLAFVPDGMFHPLGDVFLLESLRSHVMLCACVFVQAEETSAN